MTKIKNSTKTISSIWDGEDIITDPELIANHLTNHFQNLFCNSFVLQVNSLLEDSIPKLVIDQSNSLLTILPSEKEIHNAVFNLTKIAHLVRMDLEVFFSTPIGIS